MEFITKYKNHKKVTQIFKKPSKTDLSQQKETDINHIMRKFQKTGVLTHVTSAIPTFGDVSNLGDYQSCLEQIYKAQGLFEQMPAKTRERFSNDPGQFLDFMSKSENIEEAIKLGLAIPKPSNSTNPPNDDLNDDKKPKI